VRLSLPPPCTDYLFKPAQNSIHHQVAILSLGKFNNGHEAIVQRLTNHHVTDVKEKHSRLQDILDRIDRPIYRMSSQLDSVEDNLHSRFRLPIETPSHAV
jgi:HD superfamily phosphodiesterase